MSNLIVKPATHRETSGHVHCFICSHMVPATILVGRRDAFAKPGQTCPRCHSKLDSACVLGAVGRAA
jgi:hypothetical protein